MVLTCAETWSGYNVDEILSFVDLFDQTQHSTDSNYFSFNNIFKNEAVVAFSKSIVDDVARRTMDVAD
jgi:hypothetical protein